MSVWMRSGRRGLVAGFTLALAALAGCDDGGGATTAPGGDAGAGGRGSSTRPEGPPTPMPAGLTHRGRVVDISPLVGVPADAMTPESGLAGVEVCVHEMESVTCAVTDADGGYVLRGLPADSELALTFHKDGYFPMARPLATFDQSVHLEGDGQDLGTGPAYASAPTPMLQALSLCPDGSCAFLAVHGETGALRSGMGSVVVSYGGVDGLVVGEGEISAVYTGAAPGLAVSPALTATQAGGRALLNNLAPGVATIRIDGGTAFACGPFRGGSANSLPADPGYIRVPVIAGHTTVSAASCAPLPAVCGGVTCPENTLNLPMCCTSEDTGKALLCPGCGLNKGVCGAHLTFIPAIAGQCFEIARAGELDASCPGFDSQFGFRNGCCTEEGFCGGYEPAIPLGCIYNSSPDGRLLRGAPCGPQPGFTCGGESCATKAFSTPPCCTAAGTGEAGHTLELAGLEAGKCGTLVDGICLQTEIPGAPSAACPAAQSGLPGCCTSEGFCGQIDPTGRGCIYPATEGKGAPCTSG